MKTLRILFSLLVIIAISFLILKTELFRVKKVIISHYHFSNVNEIMTYLPPNRHLNMILYPSIRTKQRILRQFPAIQNIKVIHHWLKRSIEVIIIERVPFAFIVEYPYPYLVDSSGYIINVDHNRNLIPLSEHINLPLITGIPITALKNRFRIRNEYLEILWGKIAPLIHIFGTDGLTINLNDLHDIRVLTHDLIEVKYGSFNDNGDRLKLLQKIVDNCAESKSRIEYIDLKLLNHPVVKFFAN